MPELTRQQLYDAVWSKSSVQLAKDFGVSDVTIDKTCRKHKIPKPPLGYWAKLEHGHPVEKPPLPKVDEPWLQTIHIEPVPDWLRESPLPEDTVAKMDAEKADANKI